MDKAPNLPSCWLFGFIVPASCSPLLFDFLTTSTLSDWFSSQLGPPRMDSEWTPRLSNSLLTSAIVSSTFDSVAASFSTVFLSPFPPPRSPWLPIYFSMQNFLAYLYQMGKENTNFDRRPLCCKNSLFGNLFALVASKSEGIRGNTHTQSWLPPGGPCNYQPYSV